MLPLPPKAELTRRVRRLLIGLLLFGVGVAFTAVSELGLAPWEVLHQGISRRTGVPLGTVGIIMGAFVLIAWIPLRERVGLGTILNFTIIGVIIDLTLLILPEQAGSTMWRWGAVLGGIALVGLGSGLYIGAGLGPGPRDGLMTAFARRGHKMHKTRTIVEVLALFVGWLLGGTIGSGTVLYAFGVGPAVGYFFRRTGGTLVSAHQADSAA
jgi:uncharacterized membrane protein YczE